MSPTPHAQAAACSRLRAGLPPLAPTTELILRPESDRPVAILRPVGAAPRTFVLDGDDVVELVPRADARLPAAPLLGDPALLVQALAPQLGPVSSPQLVAWRPGRRAVVRLQCGSGAVFVKFLDQKTYARAAATFAALGDAAPPLRFARPVALLPALCGYAAASAPGRSLRELLAGAGQVPWDLLDATLRSLRAVPPIDGAPCHDFASARQAAATMLRKASFLDDALAGLAAAVDGLAAPASPGSGFVHGDLHDKQIFVADGATHLIDLEGVGGGDPAFDVVNLAEHLRLRALQQTGDDDGNADELLRRRGPGGSDLPRWRAVVRARLCGVYALRPRWERLTARLRTETLGLLAGRA